MILDGATAVEVLAPTAMLLLFTGIFVIIAVTKFRFEETKIYVA